MGIFQKCLTPQWTFIKQLTNRYKIMINTKTFYDEKLKLVIKVHSAANANDDYREIGEFVRSPFWGERWPNRIEFKPNGAWINSVDLRAIVDYIDNYKAP